METKQVKTKKKKLSRSGLMLIIASAIILVPIIIFLIILGTSMIGNNTPKTGNRFKNDLDPAITETNKNNILKETEGLSGVEKVEVNLPTAELRIYVDTNDSLSKDEIKTIAEEVYDIVDKEIPVSTYFTVSSNGEKMYDLEITVYNYVDGDESGRIIYTLTKNSKMDEAAGQFTSEPISPETAASVTGQSSDTTDTTTTTTE